MGRAVFFVNDLVRGYVENTDPVEIGVVGVVASMGGRRQKLRVVHNGNDEVALDVYPECLSYPVGGPGHSRSFVIGPYHIRVDHLSDEVTQATLLSDEVVQLPLGFKKRRVL